MCYSEWFKKSAEQEALEQARRKVEELKKQAAKTEPAESSEKPAMPARKKERVPA